jgi:hypothetical protein
MSFAADKFYEISLTFFRVDELFRANQADVSSEDLTSLVADSDAVIPGLSGADLGKAKMIKATCLYYDFLKHPPIFYDPQQGWRPPAEALECARSGRALLAKHQPGLVKWADSVLRLLEEFEASETPTPRRQPRRAK